MFILTEGQVKYCQPFFYYHDLSLFEIGWLDEIYFIPAHNIHELIIMKTKVQ